MDPAFSLADELADLHQHQLSLDEDELQLHPHHPYYASQGEALEDEFGHDGGLGLGLEAELEGLHLGAAQGVGGQDLASELLGGAEGGSSLAAELGDVVDATYDRYEDMSPPASSRTAQFDSPPRTASTSVPQLPPTDIADTLEATQSFLSRLSRLSSTSNTLSRETTSGFEGEDTANLESAAASYLKLVSQSSLEREAQLRELRELDRRLERHTNPSPPTSPTHHRRTPSLSSDTTITPPSTTSTLLDPTLFQPLYTSTSSLLTSLSALHEHAQVAKSSTADAARKLKTVKGLIAQWKGEVESVGVSEAWIASHAGGKGGEGRGGEWVREQVEWCSKRWLEAERRAEVLLTPVSVAL